MSLIANLLIPIILGIVIGCTAVMNVDDESWYIPICGMLVATVIACPIMIVINIFI